MTTILPREGFHHRALELNERWPVVYTALSKHSFCYKVVVSRFVLESGRVPLNPAMNFDFGMHGLVPKDAVITANNNLLRLADELWMFGPISNGAYAELLIARDAGLPVRFFKITAELEVVEIHDYDCELESDVETLVMP